MARACLWGATRDVLRLPLACQDWAGTKAAYRFFASPRFGEDAVLAGHFAATAARCAASGATPLLVVQDTTELVYKWAKPGGQVGLLKRAPIWRRVTAVS